MLRYKVAELSVVTDDKIEETVNFWVGQGWHFEGVQFAMRESSKRPAMAFIFFTSDDATDSETPAQTSEGEPSTQETL